MLHPKVTTAIPVYNGANFLGQAIESALGQTYGNMEVIVVNDGSTDGGATDAVARSYGGRIRYIVQENQGVGGAMNTAVAHMTGDVFTWLSHDDIHLPEKTASQIDYHRRLGKKDAILFSDFYLINEQGEIWHETQLPFEQYLKTPMLPLHTGAINGCTLFMPAHILREFGPFDASLRHVQDYDLWNKILSRHEFFLQRKTLVKYRTHPGQDHESRKSEAAIEGDALWIRMLESRSEIERVHLFGSRKKFYAAMASFLDLTPYKRAAAYAHTQLEAIAGSTLVSVIIPFFNEIDKVLRAAGSVLAQSHGNVELILVDDGSTENTTPVRDLRGNDNRVKLVKQLHAGTSAARNTGLDRAAGHYIAFLNADDVFSRDKIERQLAAMLEAGSVFSHTSYDVSYPSQLDAVRTVSAGTFTGAVFPEIIDRCPINVSTVMIHRSLVAGGLRFDLAGSEVLAWIPAAQRHELLGLDEALSTIGSPSRRASLAPDQLLQDADFVSDAFRADPVLSMNQKKVRRIDDVRSPIAGIAESPGPIESSGQDLAVTDAEVRRLFEQGEFARAAIIARRSTPLIYAHALRNVGNFEGSLHLFSDEYRKSPSREAHEDLITSLILAGRHALADAELAAYLSRHAGDNAFWFRLASCLAYVGRLHEADQIFTRDIELPLPNGLTASTAVCRFAAKTGTAGASETAFLRSRTVTFDEGGPGAGTRPRAILFLSGDSVYLKRYLEPAIRSFELRSGVSAAVHVHAVDPDDHTLRLVQSLRANCTLPIGLSWETFDRELVEPGELRSFFSVARFLVLPEILSRYQTTVLMTDLDQVVVRDLSSIFREAEAHDAALIRNPLNFTNIMNLFSASALFVSWTEQGKAFAEKVRAYLLDRITALGGRLPWHLDQTALAYGQLTSPNLRWYAIPPAALQSDPSSAETSSAPRSTTLFWSVTASDDANRSKEQNPIFQELVRTARRRKILFVCFSYSIHAAHWISQVDRSEFEVHVFPSNLGNELHDDFSDISFWALPGRPTSYNGKGIRLRSFPDDDAGVADRAELARYLAKVIASESYSFVHTMEFQHSAYTMLDALTLLQRPPPTWIATNYGADIMLFGKAPEHEQRIREVLARCDYYWSECARDVDLARRMGFAGKALPVLPNSGGIDVEKTAGLKGALEPSKRKVIAVKGYQHFAGRALTALEALGRCQGDLRDYAIVVYATFPEVRTAAERLKQTHDLDVTCLPEWVQHEEILKLHASARISIAISIADGISTSLLEAMAMGSFPIQTSTACAGEWIENGRSGFVVAPDDVDGLVAAIRKALADDQLVDTAARVNRTRIESQADSRWVAQRVKAAYAEVLHESA